MKTKLFISFAAFVAASALMSSCSNEESADSNNNSNGQLTAFTGGIVTEASMERMQLSTPEISTEVPGFLTRTSMNRNDIGGQGIFYWEPNDEIYVEDDNNKLCKSQNEITESASRTTFLVDGSYTKKEYKVYYYGTKSDASEKKKVVIASNQTLEGFNNTKHFGAAGDCGVAKAKKTTNQGKSGYRFNLKHKASYLCFLPYIPIQEERNAYKIKSIEITGDKIAGTYELTQTGLSKGTNESNKITLKVGTDGLLLANQATGAKSIENSLYAVIAPGEHKLSVKYTVFSVKDNKDLTLTKTYPSHNFAVNRICDIPVSLVFAETYSGHNYYMWDAAKSYWSGHEWDSDDPWQPKENRKRGSRYPWSKSAAGARWYNEGRGAFEASNALFKQLPNANEMAWYVLKGDGHWDNTTQWTVFGKIYTGGIWLKKLSVIAQENGKEPAALKLKDPRNRDLRASFTFYNPNAKSGKPSASEIDKYFFLPALGYYGGGILDNIGSDGYYWSSSACPSGSAYYLSFNRGGLLVSDHCRNDGLVAQPFE